MSELEPVNVALVKSVELYCAFMTILLLEIPCKTATLDLFPLAEAIGRLYVTSETGKISW